ncbi:molecular chaperone [Cronobacter dublinensis]|uniref:fimbrial biogenesis chaperone n=1 Tax=Cronobacter dublinensis TaxID=413497 RepID=UPI000CFCEECA|nr:molecular chaperone [Cronobacter dublinensis]ELQ6172612.1 molecular chaperone [Cronobacter dublinensis]
MKKLLLTALLPVALWSGIASSALTLNADRVVYNEADGDASVTVHSDEDRAYLIQTWLDSGNSTAKQNLPFVVTPPLFRLAPKSDNVIRVMYLGHGLPTDKETLLWLDVKGVPGLNDEESQVQNRMVLAINNRIKFFFRPAGLKGDAGEAIKNAQWTRAGNTVTVNNNSPFNLVLSKIDIDKELIKVSVIDNNTVIPPFSKKSYTLKHTPQSGAEVQWEAINDFGGTTKTYSQHLD